MTYLAGLFLSLASIPGYTSVSIPAGWAAMSIFLPVATWRGARLTPLHFCLGAFLAYAALSLIWTFDPLSGGFRLWQLSLIALAFYWGTTAPDVASFVRGLAVGCGLSSLLSIAQHFGFQPVLYYTGDGQAGLFYNPVFQGMTLALVIIACACLRLWLWIPALLPGLYLSHSRGAWAALGLGLLLTLIRSRKLLALTILSALLAFSLSTTGSDTERLLIWQAAWSKLSLFGHGAGSFSDLYILTKPRIIHPESAHNDALQLAFEFGIGGLFLLPILACCTSRSRSPLWPVFASFTFLSLFSFPLFTPIPACLAALCAGRIAAGGGWAWASLPNLRHGWLLRSRPWPAAPAIPDHAPIPL